MSRDRINQPRNSRPVPAPEIRTHSSDATAGESSVRCSWQLPVHHTWNADSDAARFFQVRPQNKVRRFMRKVKNGVIKKIVSWDTRLYWYMAEIMHKPSNLKDSSIRNPDPAKLNDRGRTTSIPNKEEGRLFVSAPSLTSGICTGSRCPFCRTRCWYSIDGHSNSECPWCYR